MAQVQNANSDESPGMQNTESPGCQRLGQMECPIIGEATDRIELHIVGSYTNLSVPAGPRDNVFSTTGQFDATMLSQGTCFWEALSKACAKGTWNITMSFTPGQYSDDVHSTGRMKIYAGPPNPIQAYPTSLVSSVDVPPGVRDGSGRNYFLGYRQSTTDWFGWCWAPNETGNYTNNTTLTTSFTFTSGCFFSFYFYFDNLTLGFNAYGILGSFDFVATRV